MTNQPFTLGVNYWPRRKAMFWWSSFDAGEVKEEFVVIKALGTNLFRIFLQIVDYDYANFFYRSACFESLGTVTA